MHLNWKSKTFFSLGFKLDKSENSDNGGMEELGLSYKKVVEKRENLAQPVDPAHLTRSKVPITAKLPTHFVAESDANGQMEFGCDQRAEEKLRINDIIHQSLRRKWNIPVQQNSK